MITAREAERLEISVSSVEQAVRRVVGDGVSVRSQRSVGGGSINDAAVLEISDGRRLFLKRNGVRHGALFLEEARGLLALAAAAGPRVPEPLALFSLRDDQYLLMEHVPTGSRGSSFWTRFGTEMAAMHRENRSERCGFYRDNHIGSTPQSNDWNSSWHEFFGDRRLRFQMELARRNGRADRAMERAMQRLVARISELLPDVDEGRASVLHGDLWSGNFMVGDDGEPVLIDPAVYYGHREADLAMTELFGGFSDAFYRVYVDAWPLTPGYEERRDIYNLYHLLNHLNLFGSGYAGSCRAVLRRFT